MKYLTLDGETTTKNKGSPYTRSNKLCYVGCRTSGGVYKDFKIEYGDDPYGIALRELQELVYEHDCLVGFNLKFDLHWLTRYNIDIQGKRVFDTQLAEFILTNQIISYPSLDDTAIRYGLSGKLDTVKVDYWDKGIDTPDIPEPILREYLQQDVDQTWKVFCKQQELITEKQRKIISLSNQDLLTLLEIEKNGMLYDTELSIKEGDALQTKLTDIDNNLVSVSNFPDFNPGSGDHISAVLYGGDVVVPKQLPFTFVYKDGRTKEKVKWTDVTTTFPRLVTPVKGSELKKKGFYATNEDTLRSLQPTGTAKTIISLIQERSKLEKLRGTYLHGIPKLMDTMEWDGNLIHGTLNQTVAITGRLSSSKPNMQNMDGNMGYLFKSRYT